MKSWAQGIPIVVSNVDIKCFDPVYFISNFGDMKVWVENCEDKTRTKMRVAKYLSDFGISERDGTKPILKLKVGIRIK